MTVTPAQIARAKAHGLTNVEALAAACDKHGLRFYLGCVILKKETGGRNIYGHDKGGVFSIKGDLEVTPENFKLFLEKIAKKGSISNGVGPMQITYKGHFPIMDKLKLDASNPWNNIDYGVSLIENTYRTRRNAGDSVDQAFKRAATVYNKGNWVVSWAYGIHAVKLSHQWISWVGTEDFEITPANPLPPEPKPDFELKPLADYVDNAKVSFRGGKTCSCVAWSLPLVEQYMLMMGLIRFNIDIAQLGWRTDVGDSKGTHAEGGNTDTWGQWSAAHIYVWRYGGWTMQRRNLTGVDTHAHGWPYGCPHLSPTARAQARDWDRKDAGLQGSARVQGRYPVEKWQAAYKRMSREIAAFKSGVSIVVLEDAFANRTKHDDVIALQVALCRHLPEDIVIDGDPGPQTRAALEKVGPLTSETLGKLGLKVLS